MKKIQIPSFIKGFLSCLVIVFLFSFSLLKNNFQVGANVYQVDDSQAQVYRANYASNLPNDVNGTNISYSQYQAIGQVISDMRESPNEIAGFRLYHGLKTNSPTSERVSCVYKLASNYSEPTNGSTGDNNMVTIANNVANSFTIQCPPFCD